MNPPDLLQHAARVATELEKLREDFLAAGRADAAERVQRDLAGYPAGATIPRYRRPQVLLQGTITDGARTQPLPAPAAGPMEIAIPQGLRQLDAVPGLATALAAGAAEFTQPADAGLDAYVKRLLYPAWSGWTLSGFWYCIPVTAIARLVDDTQAHAHAMHQAMGRKPPWW